VTGSTWLPALGTVLVVALVAGGLLLPRTARSHTAIDLGVPWPHGRSPRATRDALVDHLGAPLSSTTPERPPHGPDIAPEAVIALDRIVGVLERLRYSRPGTDAARTALRADAETCLASLTGGASRSARRRATWWPRSVATFRLRVTRPAPGTVEARFGGVVDHVN
jgi:hypothetical protein